MIITLDKCVKNEILNLRNEISNIPNIINVKDEMLSENELESWYFLKES